MRPYVNKRLRDEPDGWDFASDGRKASIGTRPKKSGDYRGLKPEKKKRTRRSLKRKDKALSAKAVKEVVNENK